MFNEQDRGDEDENELKSKKRRAKGKKVDSLKKSETSRIRSAFEIAQKGIVKKTERESSGEAGVRVTDSNIFVAEERADADIALRKSYEAQGIKSPVEKEKERRKTVVGAIEKQTEEVVVAMDETARKYVEQQQEALRKIYEAGGSGMSKVSKEAEGDSDAMKVLAAMQAERVRMNENLSYMRGTISENLILKSHETVLQDIRDKKGRQPTPEERSHKYYEEYIRDWFDKNLRTLESSQESFEEWGLVLQQLVADVNQLEGKKETEALGRDLRHDLEKSKNFRRFIRIGEVSAFDQTVASSNLLNNDVWEHIFTRETVNFKGEKEKMIAKEFTKLTIMGEDIREEMEKLKRLKYKQDVYLKIKKQTEAFKTGEEIARVETDLKRLRSEFWNYVNRGGYAEDTNNEIILDKGKRVFTKDEIENYGERSSALLSKKEKLQNALERLSVLTEKKDKGEEMEDAEAVELKELTRLYKAENLARGESDPGPESVIAKKLAEVNNEITKLDWNIRKLTDDQWARLMAGRLFSASMMASELNIPDLCGGLDFFMSRPQNFGEEWAQTRGLLHKKHKLFWDPAPRKGSDKETGMETYEEWIKRTSGLKYDPKNKEKLTYEEWLVSPNADEEFGGKLNFRAANFLQRMMDEMKYNVVENVSDEVDKGAVRGPGEISKELQKSKAPAKWIRNVALRKGVQGDLMERNGNVYLVDADERNFITGTLIPSSFKEGINRTKDGMFWVGKDKDGNKVARKARETKVSDYDWGSEKVWRAIRTRDDRNDARAMENDPRFGVAENISSRDMYDEISSAYLMLKEVFWGNQSYLHNATLEKLLESKQFGKNIGEFRRQKLWKNYLDRHVWMLEDADNVKEISQEAHVTPILEKTRAISAFADLDLITPEMEKEEFRDHISKKFLFYDEKEMAQLISQLDIIYAVLWRDKTFRMRTIFGSLWNALKILFKSTIAEDAGLTR